ncbi:hypothetical protein E2C01_033345 [Portunus trituberculatus]|uniref:Uncharacterized protein n=1 Tax=Portunus trituberculatus TaxID=210409 RepID=A0A5B7F367_PORTR|nr:hypothetical protein [Portunus trituberculatus]
MTSPDEAEIVCYLLSRVDYATRPKAPDTRPPDTRTLGIQHQASSTKTLGSGLQVLGTKHQAFWHLLPGTGHWAPSSSLADQPLPHRRRRHHLGHANVLLALRLSFLTPPGICFLISGFVNQADATIITARVLPSPQSACREVLHRHLQRAALRSEAPAGVVGRAAAQCSLNTVPSRLLPLTPSKIVCLRRSPNLGFTADFPASKFKIVLFQSFVLPVISLH